MQCNPSGPVNARLMIVGEAPGVEEEARGVPFVGVSGQELTSMLHEAGLVRSQCFLTNVCRVRPPDNDISAWFSENKRPPPIGHWVGMEGAWHNPAIADGLALLRKEISLVKPAVILALGNTALWALAGRRGITSWRGSTLPLDGNAGSDPACIVVPSYHPAAILRQWAWRQIAVHDFKRAKLVVENGVIPPKYNFIIRPDLLTVLSTCDQLHTRMEAGETLKLAVDIETRAGHIACLGFAWNKTDALCIPFMRTGEDSSYWAFEEERVIVEWLKALLTHPRVEVVGQNWSYDTQYIQRYLKFTPRFARDTMLGHHVCWAGMPKGLDFLSSMYCAYHVYWKDEGKEWHKQLGEDQLWAYNCKDCVVTYECDEEIQKVVDSLGLREQHDFQQGMFWPVNRAMVLGIRDDPGTRSKFAMELSDEIASREQYFIDVLGHPLNPRSTKQMKELFYGDFQQKPIINRKTGRISLDDEALDLIARREPLLRPLLRRISEYRSLGVFLSTFVNASLDTDGRIRCSFNLAGTETFRLSSSQNAFGSGLNLQNIPKGGDEGEGLELPNVRKLFLPDEDQELFEFDLRKADVHVVAWEADDAVLKEMLADPSIDLNVENARELGVTPKLAKAWVHGTDYGGGPRTMSINCGITVHAAEKMRARWFQIHPGIPEWHRRVEAALRARRYVTNAFGYRRFYFDRIEGLLPEALAWIPQSTVACVINRAWWRVYAAEPEVQVLIQVHDSLVGQYAASRRDYFRGRLIVLSQIVIPYPEPLVIPVALKTSMKSWGDCE